MSDSDETFGNGYSLATLRAAHKLTRGYGPKFVGKLLDDIERLVAERDEALARAEQAEAKLASIVTPGEKMHPGLSGRYIRVESQAPCVVSADGAVTPLPDGPFWWDGTQACHFVCEACERPPHGDMPGRMWGHSCNAPLLAVPLDPPDPVAEALHREAEATVAIDRDREDRT